MVPLTSPKPRVRQTPATPTIAEWWRPPIDDLMAVLGSTGTGLSAEESSQRLQEIGPNLVNPHRQSGVGVVLLRQVRSPLVLILIFAAVVSALVTEWFDAAIILAIVLGSALLGFLQEFRASAAVAALQARVQLRARVRRDGETRVVPAADLVPGDVVLLGTGNLVPADGRVLSSTDCWVSEAILTGETYPVEKKLGVVPADTVLAARTNSVWMGTTVRSGTAEMLVVTTGGRTVYGGVAARLALRPPETAFERGIRQFGYLLTQVMVVLVLVVFAANVFLDKPPVDSLLFAIALAVGIAPELLPVIMAINMAHGARRMAARGVIVRQLNAIENLGSMEILCTDKTGTLTEGSVTLEGGYGPEGSSSRQPVTLAAVNAQLQAGLTSPLDQALLAAAGSVDGWEKLAEIPFDFFRKRLSIVARHGDGRTLLICKGALERVLDVCQSVGTGPPVPLDSLVRAELVRRFEEWSTDGWRVLGVACKAVVPTESFGPSDEEALSFIGYLRFADPPKPDAARAVADLRSLGVEIKVISGDVAEVTSHMAGLVGLAADRMLTGRQLNEMSDEALWHAAQLTNLFVEVDPTHKERIVAALRRTGKVVGFMGDGVNDAPALHSADVGISVDSAVDVAREAASFVLIRHDLAVLRDGIVEGRRTFANTIKYIITTESANFGNMLSMAAASFFLPFLPLLATQVLLNNFLSDFPATTIATDRVDPEMVARPERWDMRSIRRFMIVFGAVSSLFDFATFGALLWVFSASAETFRTGWFVESLLTELVIALILRTRRPFFRSKPGRLLAASTIAVTALTFALPFMPFAQLFGFVPLSPGLLLALLMITAAYVVATEAAKRFVYRKLPAVGFGARPGGQGPS
ncbi:MAG TPA: magnesium-translocating P-type ATPase [Acidimicrobiia bacterium]|nr:magnesium-translocating P-type ATPase [Acidimicrobiia bacterium]